MEDDRQQHEDRRSEVSELTAQVRSLVDTTKIFVENQKEINNKLFERSDDHATRLTVIETTGKVSGRMMSVMSGIFGAGAAEAINRFFTH